MPASRHSTNLTLNYPTQYNLRPRDQLRPVNPAPVILTNGITSHRSIRMGRAPSRSLEPHELGELRRTGVLRTARLEGFDSIIFGLRRFHSAPPGRPTPRCASQHPRAASEPRGAIVHEHRNGLAPILGPAPGNGRPDWPSSDRARRNGERRALPPGEHQCQWGSPAGCTCCTCCIPCCASRTPGPSSTHDGPHYLDNPVARTIDSKTRKI
jgi:hypothetical protein